MVRLERPDLAREKSRLIQQQNEFKVKLAELEALLLEKLANAEGDILEDTDLILSLEDAKKTADEVKEKVIIATETENKINETSENYRPSANRGALVFFLMMDLRKIHSFYKSRRALALAAVTIELVQIPNSSTPWLYLFLAVPFWLYQSGFASLFRIGLLPVNTVLSILFRSVSGIL